MIKPRRLRWAGNAARMEEDSTFKILTGKPAGKIPSKRPRWRWEGNIRNRHQCEELGLFGSG